MVGGHATVGWLSNNVFWTFQAVWENIEKCRWTVTRQWLRSRDRRPTVKQRFLDVSSDLGKFWKKSLNGHATVVEVTRPSADCQTTFFGRFKRFGTIFEKSRWTVTRQWSEVTRPSADCQTTFFGRFKRFGKYFEKSRWTITRQWSEVTRPSADCQTTFFGRFKRFGNFFWKKSLNGHATVVGGHATVGRLWNNVFWTFQAIWGNFEKSRWTVTATVVEVTRPSADCQTTIFRRFKQLEFFLKEVAKRSRDSGRRSRDRRPTVKQRFLDVSSD